MTLGQKQRLFALNVSLLIMFAKIRGYEVTFGDAYRDPRVRYGADNSLHRKRLAVDLNLFKGGRYLKKSADHQPLGEFWESLHPMNTWGGRFTDSPDGNHYSMTHGGVK